MNPHVDQGLEVNIELPIPTASGRNGLILSWTQRDAKLTLVALEGQPRNVKWVSEAGTHSNPPVAVALTVSPHRAPNIDTSIVVLEVVNARLEVVIHHGLDLVDHGRLN
jgi:hypothetical protein